MRLKPIWKLHFQKKSAIHHNLEWYDEKQQTPTDLQYYIEDSFKKILRLSTNNEQKIDKRNLSNNA
jgi:hypothetical protein